MTGGALHRCGWNAMLRVNLSPVQMTSLRHSPDLCRVHLLLNLFRSKYDIIITQKGKKKIFNGNCCQNRHPRAIRQMLACVKKEACLDLRSNFARWGRCGVHLLDFTIGEF